MICRRTPPPRRALDMLKMLLLLGGAIVPATVRGEDVPSVVLSGESRGTALRLAEARKRLDEQKWPEAIEQLQAILGTAGNDLVPVTPMHSVPARRLCQVHLASLPPDALRLYRRRYETQANQKLEQGRADRDESLLRKVVEEAFCTRAAEKAIDLLGDLAFERGRFEEAEQWWRLLAPLPDAGRDAAPRGLTVVYPDPSLDPARTQAKQLLARLFRGSGAEWAAQLDDFRLRHGKAEGRLAGATGRYADRLRTLANEMQEAQRRLRKETFSASGVVLSAWEKDWPTFGGDPSRGRIVPAADDVLDRLSALCRDGPTWRFNLAERGRLEGTPPPSAVNAAQARSLAFHPILVGHQVFVADARYVTAYDMCTGQSKQWYDVAEKNDGVSPNLKLPAPPDLRYTLTAADGEVYARLGAQDIGLEATPVGPPALGQAANPRRENETFLACLGPRPNEDGEHIRWSLRGIFRERSVFEGAPLVAEGRIWIASSRYNGTDGVASIDCYPTGESNDPPLRWRRDVCKTRDIPPGESRYRHHLLTKAGTQILYCSHTGAVVAVDGLTGRTNWAIRYPHRPTEKDDAVLPAGQALHDLAPVLSAEDRLYVAPADSDLLLCLDPVTGQTLWQREAMKVVHLLGVGQGRLIFSTRDGLRAVGAADGSDASGWLFPQAGGGLTPGGRGLLIGDLILFPTVRGRDDFSAESVVYVVRQRDGMPADDPSRLHRVPAGNLAYANGCLAVADRNTLSLFVAPRLLLPRRQAEAKRHSDSAAALLALGRAEADASWYPEAVETFARAEIKARASAKSRRLLAEATTERQRVLIETARQAATARRWEDVASALGHATAKSLPARARLHALTRAAQVWQDAGQTTRAVAVWESILADDALRPFQLIDRQGTPVSASAAATLALARLRGEQPPPRLASPARAIAPRSAGPTLPLFRTWHARLAADEWVLDGWRDIDSEHLLTGSSDGWLNCRLTSSGEIHWRHRLPFVPRWAGCHAELILVASDRDVACLRRDDGERLWHFPAPAPGRYPSAAVEDFRVVEEPQTPELFSVFRLVAGRLFFLQGQRRLFALNAETGDVLWDRWAPDGGFHLPSPRGCFAPFYHVGSKTVLLQSAGQRWLLDAATGRTLHQDADSRILWPRPPLELDERTLAVVSDRRHVLLLDAESGRALWTHALRGSTTLSGEPPQLLGRDDLLLLVMPTNIGYFLQRLDRATGEPAWPQPCLLTMKRWNASAWTFDAEAVYVQEDRALVARSLADGRELWRRILSGAQDWQVRRLADCLVVYPVPSEADLRFRFRSPLGSVQWLLGPALQPEVVFAVHCRDPKTGREVQRLNFRIETPARTTWQRRRTQEGRGLCRIVRTSPLLANEDGPVLRLSSPRPFLAVGGEVWGLTVRSEINDAERR